MKENGTGGASTKTGALFEGKTDLRTFLSLQPGYSCEDDKRGWVSVSYRGEKVADIFKKGALYKFLQHRQINWKSVLSKKLLPDDAIYVIANNTFFVIECKFQRVAGSVDEKLQTCDFKKKQYQKLLAELRMNVEYIYLLNDWFKDPKYRGVLEYITSVGCSYYFGHIPLSKFGLQAEAQTQPRL